MGNRNARGVIAESYHELQGLSFLEAARAAIALPPASPASTLRTVLQAAEIGMLNLADLLRRAAFDVEQKQLGRAVAKLSWAHGFHRVLVQLSLIPKQIARPIGSASAALRLELRHSPGFAEFLEMLERFDRQVLGRIADRSLLIDEALANQSIDAVEFRLLHLARVGCQEGTVWEQNLAETLVEVQAASYDAFVAAAHVRRAAAEPSLAGDTFFMQFRGLHQIPETLATEAGDHLAQAVRCLRTRAWSRSAEFLRTANLLLGPLLAALPPIVDNLATNDYHNIRENLGLTSGGHSVALHYHLFNDLYEQWWDELVLQLAGRPPTEGPNDGVEDLVQRISQARHDDAASWLSHLLIEESLRLRANLHQWRQWHVHLPRNNLGGNATRSLTGSVDAVMTVQRMRDLALEKDPMAPLAAAFGLATRPINDERAPLARYLDNPASLDQYLLAATARLTQQRFVNVQQRTGVFAGGSSFEPPPKRLL